MILFTMLLLYTIHYSAFEQTKLWHVTSRFLKKVIVVTNPAYLICCFVSDNFYLFGFFFLDYEFSNIHYWLLNTKVPFGKTFWLVHFAVIPVVWCPRNRYICPLNSSQCTSMSLFRRQCGSLYSVMETQGIVSPFTWWYGCPMFRKQRQR